MDNDLLELARTIRPYLPDLVAEEADDYDRRIASLLSQATSGIDVSDQVVEIFTQAPPVVRNWIGLVLEDDLRRPPEFQGRGEPLQAVRGIDPLPGPGEPIDAQKYVCPEDGNYVWWRPSVGVRVRT
jgi:hypothetical protein